MVKIIFIVQNKLLLNISKLDHFFLFITSFLDYWSICHIIDVIIANIKNHANEKIFI